MKQTANRATKKPDALMAHFPAHQAAIRPSLNHELHQTVGDKPIDNGRDFSQVPINSTESANAHPNLTHLCPFSPQRCPFGGACHTCLPRVQATQAVGIQRKSTNNNELTEVPPIVHEVLSSPGQPLDPATRSFFEPRFGHDFSRVRVYTDDKAAESARMVHALAYTVGNDVVFGAGQFAPSRSEGQRLLAHELTHVVQQKATTVNTKLELDTEGSQLEVEAERKSFSLDSQKSSGPNVNTSASAGLLQRQLFTPLAPGGGFRGLMERDRRRTTERGTKRQEKDMTRSNGGCNVRLCFLPLQLLLDHGVSPENAYAIANHAFIRWGEHSAGFTRLPGESKSDARVISPEPRAGEPHERCIHASLRTIPTPTPGQMIHFSPLDEIGDIFSYGSDVVSGLSHCQNPSCTQAHQRIERLIVDDLRGLYDLYDENCETWARNVLAAACMEAPEIRLGGAGNLLQRILRETTPGRIYHGVREGTGRTRPLTP